MNYQWHYDRLIETRKVRQREKGKYYERHHIVPKSMGGSNEKENLVYLTAREHFLAHWLLFRIYRNREMALAFNAMRTVNKGRSVSSGGYTEAREAFAEIMRETMRSKKFSDEHRKNIGKSSKGRKSVHRRKISVNGEIFEALHIASSELKIPVMTIRNRLINTNFPDYFYMT
jgi:hypothetical protein